MSYDDADEENRQMDDDPYSDDEKDAIGDNNDSNEED